MSTGAEGDRRARRRNAAWRAALVMDSVRPIVTVVAILFVGFTVTNAMLLPPSQRLPMTLVSGAMALVLVLTRLWLAVRPPPPSWAHPIVAAVAGLALGNAIVHMAVAQEPHQTTSVMLVLVAAGVFLLATRWLVLVIATAWVAWAAVGVASIQADPWGHYAFALLSASIVALLAHETRLRSIRRIEELREADEAQRAGLETANAELRRSEERFRKLTEASFEAVLVHRDQRVVDANPAFAALFGHELAAARGMNILELVAPEERDRVSGRIRSGADEPYETVGLRRDGTLLQIEVHVRTVPWGDGVARVSALRDVTVQKARERELAQALAELRRSNEELERFAYVVSHDLQAPLRTIASFSEMLHDDWRGRFDEDADQLLDRIVAAVTRMRRLLLDLLAYARVGTAEANFEPVDLERVLAAAMDDHAAAVEESGAAVTHDPLPTVVADEAQVQQLFSNLVGNALKFRSDGPPVVHVSARPDGDRWVLSVRDNGIGIDMRYADAIFNVFERLHAATEYPGTGIGLAICKRIVERHGGRIGVNSRPNEGATFWFTLPA